MVYVTKFLNQNKWSKEFYQILGSSEKKNTVWKRYTNNRYYVQLVSKHKTVIVISHTQKKPRNPPIKSVVGLF